ncbi:MAG TPA: glycosyltransferase 87 family protein [Acidobacteriaceae bacterium]|nr:glycosyltransferase 87 family protein [Acidobacteriaceae bacterium]
MTQQPWVTNCALALLGLFLLALCRQGVDEIHHFFIGFGLVAMYQALGYLVAVWIILNRPVNRWTLLIVIVCAVACRLVCLFSPPFLSTDVFRYVWDGQVQAAGINPYRYIPADSHLAFLRDLDIYPHINRRDYAHTIYPPGAQMLFLLISRIGASVRWMKAGMVGLESLAIWILVKLLRAVGLRREQVLIYAWHPMVLWEVASSGHVDGVALPLIALALLFYVRHKPAATGIALAAATLIKLYPIALFPALYRRSEWRDWRMPATVVGMVAAGYACYASVGRHVLGFLPEYAKEEGLESGSRYFLLTLARHGLHWESLPTGAFYAFAALLLLGLALWAWWTSETGAGTAIRYAFVLATALMLLFSAHYPWYYLWLLPFVCLIPYVPMLYFTTACFYLYTTSLANPGPPMYYMFEWLYATTALLALWCMGAGLLQTRRSPRGSTPHKAFAIYARNP